MGCCIGQFGRNKIDPTLQSPSKTRKISATEVPRSSLRYSRRPTKEIIVHPSIEDNYKLLAFIGKGAFGQVVRVEHNKTKKPYAMKIIELQKNAEHEIEILKTVNHRYVIKLHEVIKKLGKLYLVMDLATGGELMERIQQLGNFSEKDASRVITMILEGIQYLHSVGITHRDLKPDNILYYHPGSESRIIITDFGLAAIREPGNNLMNTDCGTVEYMAPEVIQGHAYTNSVDMWSIGVITYIVLSGKLPFPITKLYSLLRAICFGKFNYDSEVWKSISGEAKSFINSLLIVEAKKRPSASEAIQHKWIKERWHKKKNLQRSISSNWTESCLSLDSLASKNGQPRKYAKLKERVIQKETLELGTNKNAKPTKKTPCDPVAICPETSCNATEAAKRCLDPTRKKFYQSIDQEDKTYRDNRVEQETWKNSSEDTLLSQGKPACQREELCSDDTKTERRTLKKTEGQLQTRQGIGTLPPL